MGEKIEKARAPPQSFPGSRTVLLQRQMRLASSKDDLHLRPLFITLQLSLLLGRTQSLAADSNHSRVASARAVSGCLMRRCHSTPPPSISIAFWNMVSTERNGRSGRKKVRSWRKRCSGRIAGCGCCVRCVLRAFRWMEIPFTHSTATIVFWGEGYVRLPECDGMGTLHWRHRE